MIGKKSAPVQVKVGVSPELQKTRQEQVQHYLCLEHGMCSRVACGEPIIGWEECYDGRKLCEKHLSECEARGEATHRPQRWGGECRPHKRFRSDPPKTPSSN